MTVQQDDSLVGTFGNDTDASLYRQFGYFYTKAGGEGVEPSITTVLFNGKYKLRVESAGGHYRPSQRHGKNSGSGVNVPVE